MFARSKIWSLGLALSLAGPALADSSSKTFTVTNTGDGDLTVSNAVIAGNSTEFALTGNTCSIVAPGATCELSVTFTPNGDGPRPAATLQLTSNGSDGPGPSVALTGTGKAEQVINLASFAVDVNMASLFGNPTEPGRYILIVNPGVLVSASSPAVAALTTGRFPAGSTVKLVNRGFIIGKGGAGGQGGSVSYASLDGSICYQQTAQPGPGQPGGSALALNTALVVDNSAGYLFGGGGGGGGSHGAGYTYYCGSGGSGGGAGAGGAAGGPGGSSSGYGDTMTCAQVYSAADASFYGVNTWGGLKNKGGAQGAASSPASGGGAGGAPTPVATGSPNMDSLAGSGGAGGGYGEAGQAGATSYQWTVANNGCMAGMTYQRYSSTGAPGAAGGAAVESNGHALTWAGGNTGAQVKGAVQ